MGVANLPDILQQKMNDLFHGLKCFHANIVELLILTKGGWNYHVQKTELTLDIMNEKGLKCDIEIHFLDKLKLNI